MPGQASEAGLNFAEWTLRGRYMLTNNKECRTDEIYIPMRARISRLCKCVLRKLERINVNSGLFGGAPINGVQLI